MGVFYEEIPDSLASWIQQQKLLWVGTAPLSPNGHINVSPKGGQSFGILSPRLFWYMDLTGSGAETHAHLHEPGNGRICVMFMELAPSKAPRIVRLWGIGRAVENGTGEYEAFVKQHDVAYNPGNRSVILVDVHQVGSSCGFSVPQFEFKGFRRTLDEVFERKERKFLQGKEEESMDRYWAWKSQLSIDGLPAMKRGYDYARKNDIAPLEKMVGKWAPGAPRTAQQATTPAQLCLLVLLSVVIGAVLALTTVSPEYVRRLQHKEVFGFW